MIGKLSVGAVLACCLARAVLPQPAADHAYYAGVVILIGMAIAAIARRAPGGRLPWLLTGGPMAVCMSLDWFGIYDRWAAPIWLAMDATLICGLVIMVRRRAAGQIRAGLLDGLSITAAASVVLYQELVRPIVDDTWTTVEIVMESGFWVSGMAKVGTVLFLVLSPGKRGMPTRLLAGGYVWGLLTGAGGVAAEIHGVPEEWLFWAGGLNLLATALPVFAISHRGRDELITPVRLNFEPLHPARVLFLGFAMLTAPLLAIVKGDLDNAERIPLAIGTVLTVGFSLTRFTTAVRAQNRAQRQLAHNADHDTLTGLANRRAFNHHLERRRPTGTDLTLLYIDLDHFKPINDQYGHAAGDAVLVEVGRRLHDAVREDDVVARLGGDEFAILCPGLGEAGRGVLADRVVEKIAEPIAFGGHSLQVGASIGVATMTDADIDPEALVFRADHAMFGAKQGGRGRAVVSA